MVCAVFGLLDMSKSLTERTASGFIWSAAGSFGKAILQIAVISVLAHLLEVQSFGVVQAAMVVVGFAKLISMMGIGPALVQRKEITQRHVRVGFTLSLSLGLILASGLFLFSDSFARLFSIEEIGFVLRVLSLLFLLESFVTVSSSLLQRDMRFKEIAMVDIISYFFGYGLVGVYLGFKGYEYWALIAAIFTQEIIKLAMYFKLKSHSLLPLWSKKEFKDLVHYGVGHTIAKIANFFTTQGDNFVVSRYLGAQQLGYYGLAFTLMVRPYSLIITALDKALFPALSKIQDDKEKLKHNFEIMIKILTLILIPVFLVLLILAENIVFFLLGEKWAPAIVPFQILTFGIIFRVTTRISDVLVRAVGDVYSRAWRRSISAVVMLICCYIGQKYMGINGVALGVVFTNLVTCFLMATLTFKHIKVSWMDYIKLYSKGMLLGLIFGALLFSSKLWFEKLVDIHLLIIIFSTSISVLITIYVVIANKNFFISSEKEYIVFFLNRLKLSRLSKMLD